MSADAQRFLEPSATLVVDARQGYHMHLDRFPGAEVVPRSGTALRQAAEEMLDEIDVLLTLETPYDFSIFDIARAKGVRTVLVAMPEYHRPYLRLPQPDLIVNPTPYMHDLFDDAVCLPWPVDLDAVSFRHRTQVGEWLHVIGQAADHDRAGTALVVDTFEAMADQKLVIRVQNPGDRRLKAVLGKAHSLSNITILAGDVADTRELYDRGDIFFAPRRYAGQSLPANEAQAAGLPLVCLDRTPDATWTLPELTIAYSPVATDRRFGFEIAGADVDDAVAVCRHVSDSPSLVANFSAFSRSRAEAMSWQVLRDDWLSLLAG